MCELAKARIAGRQDFVCPEAAEQLARE